MADTVAPQACARLTGAAYLAIFILAILANFFVVEPMIVPGDAEMTLANLVAGETAFRMAIAAFFLVLMFDLTVSWGLYILFSGAARQLTLFTILFRLAYTIGHIPVVLNLVEALRLATHSNAMPLIDTPERAAWVTEYLMAHSMGFTMTLLFFGVHLVALGVLIWRTRFLPRAIGVLVTLAGLGYLLDGFLWLVAPGLRNVIPGGGLFIVILPALIGEGAITFWLLLRGIDIRRWRTAQMNS